MINKLWYIDQDVDMTVYRAKFRSSSDAFVHSISGSTLHHLWHHRLCHTGDFATTHINKVADGVPSICTRNPFFSCGDCSNEKMTKKITGYNKNPQRATFLDEIFNMGNGFVRGATTFKNESGPLITNKGFNCCLLIVCR